MLAAEAAYDAIVANRQHDELSAYPEAFERSWLFKELNKSRNFKAWFKWGLTIATLMNGVEQFALRGNMPWTLRRTKTIETLQRQDQGQYQQRYPPSANRAGSHYP